MTQTQEKKFQLSTSIFDKMRAIDGDVWFGEDIIINTRGNEVSSKVGLRYQPKAKLFAKAFGIKEMGKFISLMKSFEQLNFEFKGKYIIITDDNGSCLTYRLPGEANFIKKRASIEKIANVFTKSIEMVQASQFLHFRLDTAMLSKIKNSGRTIQEADTVSVLTMRKPATTESLLLTVSNVDSEHTASWNLGINNSGQFLEFNAKINIDNLPDGNWDAYLFVNSVVWMYLADTENNLDAIVVFNK